MRVYAVFLCLVLLMPAAWAIVPRTETKEYRDPQLHPGQGGTTWIDFLLDGTESQVRFTLTDESGMIISGQWGFWRLIDGGPYLQYAGGGGFCGQSDWITVPPGSYFVDVHPDTFVHYQLTSGAILHGHVPVDAAYAALRCGATARGFATSGTVTAEFN